MRELEDVELVASEDGKDAEEAGDFVNEYCEDYELGRGSQGEEM
jgi:hypothetical protein